MINIKKGQYFVDNNNQKYVFLGYKNPNIIYCVDEDFKNTKEILLFDVDVINSILDMENKDVKNMNWYYQCEEELESNTLSDKLNYLLVNIKNDFEEWEKELDNLKLDIRIKKISSLVKGRAFYSNQNQTYEVIGFIVETETYEKGKKIEENKGLFSIYHSKCDNLAPMTFFYKENNNKFYNKETNDYCIVEKELISDYDVNNYIQTHGFSVPVLSNEKEELNMEF